MIHLDFSTAEPFDAGLVHVYSPVAKSCTRFHREGDCIANAYNEAIKEYDYISLADPNPHRSGVTVSTRCSFDKYGAPLVTLANELFRGDDGELHYGAHYEVVVYEKGCNIWYVVPAPEKKERPFTAKSVARLQFPLNPGARISLQVTVKGGMLQTVINGFFFAVAAPDLNETFYAGITACEGINRFYSLKIDGDEQA